MLISAIVLKFNKNMLKIKRNAYTLMEMVLVVCMIGILAAIGTTSYTKSKAKATAKEAISNLKLIAAAERIYKMENGTGVYIACNCSSAANCINATGCNTLLNLNLNTANWTYTVTLPTASSAKAQATGSGTYTICSSNFDAEPASGTSCP